MAQFSDNLCAAAFCICSNRTCSKYGKRYDTICVRLNEYELYPNLFDEASVLCDCCSTAGYLGKYLPCMYELREDDDFLFAIKFDNELLDVMTNLLRNMQDRDVPDAEQVYLASDEAFNVATKFGIVREKPDGSFVEIVSQNKVIIVNKRFITLQCDIRDLDSANKNLTTVTSEIYYLEDLIDLREFASICESEEVDHIENHE